MKINEQKYLKLANYIKVSILEDDIEYRNSLKKILLNDKRIHIYGEYSSPYDFISSFNSPFKPNVCLVDIVLQSDISGIECCKIIKDKNPDIHIIIMTSYPDPKYIAEAKEIGADFIEKGTRGEILIDKIVTYPYLETQEQFISLKNRQEKINSIEILTQLDFAQQKVTKLSGHQRKVLKLRIEGKSSPEIAVILKMNPRTVRTHLRRALQKLELPNLLKYIDLSN